jgi:hypothetical protein
MNKLDVGFSKKMETPPGGFLFIEGYERQRSD